MSPHLKLIQFPHTSISSRGSVVTLVAPQFRRHGIGTRLVSALENVARDLGFTTIYSGTSTANSLLMREGWRFMEVVQYNGEAVSIYEKTL